MKKEGAIRKTAGIRKAASVLILAAFLITAAIFLIHKNVPCKVAMLHMNPEYHQKEANITEICELAAEAFENGADIVLTPEMATDDYYLSEQDVVTYAGIRNIEAELAPIAELADQYNGYICVGFPEIAEDGTLYNSAVMFDKEGNIVLHERKRSIPDWNSVGELTPAVADTEYGKIGIIICADAYFPENAAALGDLGADMILSPVTWYPIDYEGHSADDDVNCWTARAKENSVWFLTCNRWGTEMSNGEIQDMNMGKSAVVSPKGEIVYQYAAEDCRENTVLYYELKDGA